MNLFLKIPHWGLFLLLLVLLVLGFPFVLFGPFLGVRVLISLVYFEFLFLPSAIVIGWFFSMGKMLYNLHDSAGREKTSYKLFRFNILFIFSYLVLFYVSAFVIMDENLLHSPIILPLHLYAVYALFYGGYFVSRNLATAENKGSGIGDYIGYLLLLVFFPIGMWVIQPKINRFYQETG